MSWTDSTAIETAWNSGYDLIVLNDSFTVYDVEGLSYDTPGVTYDRAVQRTTENSDLIWDNSNNIETAWT